MTFLAARDLINSLIEADATGKLCIPVTEVRFNDTSNLEGLLRVDLDTKTGLLSVALPGPIELVKMTFIPPGG